MEDFPDKVATETGTPNPQSPEPEGNSLRGLAANVTASMDMNFARTVPAALMITEIILGLIQWSLIASAPYTAVPVYGWVMFVAVTLWILTTILFFMVLFAAHQKIPFVHWPMAMMAYNGVAAVLYLTAFIANAATVNRFGVYQGHIGAAAFFGAVLTLAYGAGAFFSYLDWRGDRGNAATGMVPT